MRHRLTALFAAAAAATAADASAQADRYGGMNAYPMPAYGPGPQQPGRVLSWPGKSIPAPPAAYYPYPQGGYGAPMQPPPYAERRNAPPAPYAQPRGAPYPAYPPIAYYPYPQQPQMAQPQMGPPQMQQMPAANMMPPPQQPMVPAPPPGNTASGPNGVYPAQPYVPPGLPAPGMAPNAYPPAPFPQGPMAPPMPPLAAQPAQPGQPLPNSIYAPAPAQPRQVGEATEPKPAQLAMNSAAQANSSARLYSVHRPFGMNPDPAPVTQDFFGPAVDLAEPPQSEPQDRRITSNGQTRRAPLRSLSDDSN